MGIRRIGVCAQERRADRWTVIVAACEAWMMAGNSPLCLPLLELLNYCCHVVVCHLLNDHHYDCDPFEGLSRNWKMF